MKRSQLRNIIKEEIKKVLNEGAVNPMDFKIYGRPSLDIEGVEFTNFMEAFLKGSKETTIPLIKQPTVEVNRFGKGNEVQMDFTTDKGGYTIIYKRYPQYGEDYESIQLFLDVGGDLVMNDYKEYENPGHNPDLAGKEIGRMFRRAEENLPTNSFIFENKQPTLVDTWYTIPGGRVYKVVVEFDDGSKEKFRTLKDAEAKYNLEGVKETESEFDVS